MKRLYHLFIYSNCYTVVVIAALIVSSNYLYYSSFVLHIADWFILSGTLFLYTLHRLYALYKKPNSSIHRLQKAAEIKNSIIVLCGIGLATSIITGFYLTKEEVAKMIPVIVLGALYSFPVFKVFNLPALREIPILKPFIIALTVAYATTFALLPVNAAVLSLFILRFLFLSAVTLPFDIRDITIDKNEKIKTPAVLLGVQKTKNTALLFNAVFTGVNITVYLFTDLYSFSVLIAFWLSEFYTSYYIYKINKHQNDSYYTYHFEGGIILQSILVIAADLFVRF